MKNEKENKINVCKQCGKKLSSKFNYGEYAYKIDNKNFCSWTCLRAYEKEHYQDTTQKILDRIEKFNKQEELMQLKNKAKNMYRKELIEKTKGGKEQ